MADWIVMPVIDCPEYTFPALEDCLAQVDVDVRVLVINNGSTDEMRGQLEMRQEKEPRLFVWHHCPPLPSLSATWNAALDFVWQVGGESALVVNNDVRLHPATYAVLKAVQVTQAALFVSAVGVKPDQFVVDADYQLGDFTTSQPVDHGGPDFSCFLLTKAGHAKYPFDEGFIPAYGEDCTNHREYMLGGDGDRIFSINLPFAHFGSRTINRSPEAFAALTTRLKQSQDHYERCWGGKVNHERYTIKGDPTSAQDGVTNPELQARGTAPQPVV